jgi:CDP-diacylglycerol--glycerol-3-phosphate 3-phosphatidyltransferase
MTPPTQDEPPTDPAEGDPGSQAPARWLGAHQLPNAICLGRVVAVFWALALMGQVFLDEGRWSTTAVVVITLAALSDRLDGFLAKRYGWSTRLGALLDQISDKLVSLALFSFLVVFEIFPAWALALVIFRELFVTCLRITANLEKIAIKTSQAGRFKTFNQQVAVLFIFAQAAYGPVWVGLTGAQLVLWGGWVVFWVVMLAKGKRGFAAFKRIYTTVRPDPQTGEERVVYADLVLVYMSIAAMAVPLPYGAIGVVLIITVGTGWTYFSAYLWARHVLGIETGTPPASLRNAILSALGSAVLAGGLAWGLVAGRLAGAETVTLWSLVAALSAVWIVLSTASYLTGERPKVTPTSA